MKQSGSVHTRLCGQATDGSRPPASQTPIVPNPLRPTGAGDGSSCDRRERVERDSPAGQGCPEVSSKPTVGGFEGLRVQPCFIRFREPPRPGRQPRWRHAEAVPDAPPRRVGGGTGRRERDAGRRCSRPGENERGEELQRKKREGGNRGAGTESPFMPEGGTPRRKGDKSLSCV